MSRLPFSIKVLLENMLRGENGRSVQEGDIEALARWSPAGNPEKEMAFTPARVLMQDLTGVPAVVDLAAMRDAIHRLGGDPNRINPVQPTDLVIDHSVQIDRFGSADALRYNAERAFRRGHCRWCVAPSKPLTVRAKRGEGSDVVFTAMTRIETPDEVAYYRHGGILPYVLRQLLKT